MRAAIIRSHGSPEVLQIGEVPIPSVGDGEVLVRVRATSVNPVDCSVRAGGLRRFAREPFPIVPGVDLCGTVERCGSSVRAFNAGDEVFAYIPRIGGSCAEFAACDASWLARKPVGLSYAKAAVVPCVGLTALQALRDKARLRPGQSVLIVGASGGVGTMAVQIARTMGVEVVGVCSTRNIDLVLSLGASRVIDYMQKDPLTDSQRYDAVFDCIGNRTFWSYRRLLRSGGRHVGISCSRGKVIDSVLSQLTPGPKSFQFHVRAEGVDLEQLSTWIENEELRPIISEIYPLEAIAAAHRKCETHRTVGKIAITIN